MSTSPITQILNHLSYATVTASVAAGIGYLCGRSASLINSAWEIDPRVGIIAGAAIGAIAALFNEKGANISSRIVLLASACIVPYQLCQMLNVPTTVKTIAAITFPILISMLLMTTFVNQVCASLNKKSDPAPTPTT